MIDGFVTGNVLILLVDRGKYIKLLLVNIIMGICVGKPNRSISLLMVGLDNAGKTSTAKGIVGQLSSDVAPTLGFASFKTKQQNFDVTIYDVGGGKAIRGIWRNYLAESYGFIFVVDSSDAKRFQECQDVLYALLKNPAVSGKPLLILANKHDVEGALDELEVSHTLDVEALVNEVRCRTRVEASSAIKGCGKKLDRGIVAGFRWLLATIEQDYVRLHEKVTKDVSEQREREDKERIQREERIKKLREERAKLQSETDIKEGPIIKEDPFKPLTVVVKEYENKELRQKEIELYRITNGHNDNNGNIGSVLNSHQQVKNVSELISDSPFETVEPVSPTNSPLVYETFQLARPPGSIEDDKVKKVVSKQSTIDESEDEVLISPNYIAATSDKNGPRKKPFYRRKNRTAPLPPVQTHSMLCDRPPLTPIANQDQTVDSNEMQSQEIVEQTEISHQLQS